MAIRITELDVPNFKSYADNTVHVGSERTIKFSEQIQALKEARDLNLANHPDRGSKSVVISGSGPAGLLHAIGASLSGYAVKVVEKRPEIRDRRNQVVAIDNTDALETLYALGVIDWLVERNKVHHPPHISERLLFPNDTTTIKVIDPTFVSIGDLENALEEVLKGIHNGSSPISHESTLTINNQDDGSFTVQIADKDHHEEVIRPHSLFIAEGKRSENAELMGFRKVDILPPITMIVSTASITPQRPAHRTWQEATQYNLYVTGCKIYYFVCFLLESVGKATRLTHSYQASLCFSTPQTSYIGVAVHQDRLAHAKRLSAQIEELKKTPGNTLLIEQKTTELNGIISYWANIGYFEYEALRVMMAVRAFFVGGLVPLAPTVYVPFQTGNLVEMETSQRALDGLSNKIVGPRENTQIVGVTGDTRFTVDFSTGRGVSNILASFARTHHFFQSLGNYFDDITAIHALQGSLREPDFNAIQMARAFRTFLGN